MDIAVQFFKAQSGETIAIVKVAKATRRVLMLFAGGGDTVNPVVAVRAVALKFLLELVDGFVDEQRVVNEAYDWLNQLDRLAASGNDPEQAVIHGSFRFEFPDDSNNHAIIEAIRMCRREMLFLNLGDKVDIVSDDVKHNILKTKGFGAEALGSDPVWVEYSA